MSGLPYRYPPQYNQPKPAATAPASMSTQRFCLRWNNHQSNLLSVFDQLLHDESFVDVTLAVEGQLLRAHKMVLSACSPYFQALFVNHPDKHPIVILKDVPYSDMKSLLDFMYRGEVSVDQDRLTHFLRVAESLRIKGLTEVNEEKCDNIASSLSQQNSNHVPNLQRIQQNKRIAGNFNMLGNYLMQPKRKRGRPRRLSGNSNGDDTDNKDSLVQGSPEMLEVKMGMDGFTGSNSDGSTGKEEEDIKGVKEEPEEPIAGTSNDTRSAEEIQADSMTPQQLLTPKIEVDENFDSNSDQQPTPESSRMGTPDSVINNNNNTSTPSTSTGTGTHTMSAPPNRPPPKRRIRRRATSQSQDPAEQLTEMSVRGLNLFRYASINEGVYQCTECAKVDVTKTFKNKYSFQRHAFLYHEGQQRKVFPCPVCQKEFSRPDKMKNHMKTVHDCFMPKDAVVNDVVFPPMGFFPSI
ncbi:protein tramtrack, alpha isoform-like isoform X4 [Cylas formicarius]|uniref:protein tramtrack, alpha isoform-like isoform X4 n=1 Tax=Cylas formicarius TaxID=197179 RepID=UPI00295845E2|nr:protein tramtrack, alpha isoform-like isoform X4 [Cylas formicarius]